jgi:outer membrane receptor protein involved in Fe transport
MKLSVSILTCIAFTLFSNFSFGQDFIYGKVIDEEGSPLFDVEVFWEANNDLDRAKQRTTNDGTFKIKIAKDSTQVLGIKYPGKKEVRKRITDAEHNEFILIELKEKGVTSITASRWEQNVNEIPASVVVISREEIAQNGYMTLQEIIENVPGLFTLDHRTENGITIGVRGFWSDVNRNVMIQVNGVNMLSERWMDFGFDKINVAVEAIDKIEIVRGPMNVIYGSGAFFGVINVITNDNQNQNSGIVATGFGFQSQNNGNPFSKFGPSGIKKNFFRYSGGNSEFNFSLNAMTYQRGGFQELWDDMVLDTTYEEDAENTSFPGYPNSITISKYKGDTIHPRRYSKYHQALNLSVSYNGFFADVNYASSNQGVSFYSQPGPGDRNDYRSYTGNFQFGYRGSANGDRFNYQAKVAYMKSNTVGEMKYYSDDAFSYGEDRVSTIRAEFNTRTNLSEMISNKSNFQVDLLAGLYFSRNFENNSFYNLPGFVLNNWLTGVLPGSSVDTKAAYIQTEVKFKNWIVVSGIRAEYLGSYEIINSTNAGTDDYNPVIDTVKADRIPTFSPRLAVIYKKASKKKGS